jgi:hypothetical protein
MTRRDRSPVTRGAMTTGDDVAMSLREEQLERHGPDEPTLRLSLTDDVFLRSSNGARL